ncbi:MAG TPA: hypothetical protein VMR98_02105, partial [Candidatus Polarisedimenticolaceae bacterium]|nr:hypothetical protein [Candidatus Polarisedimenticolaceae bacterium]
QSAALPAATEIVDRDCHKGPSGRVWLVRIGIPASVSFKSYRCHYKEVTQCPAFWLQEAWALVCHVRFLLRSTRVPAVYRTIDCGKALLLMTPEGALKGRMRYVCRPGVG